MEPRNLNRHFANLRASAGLPDVRLHDFRHTVVSMLMELGVQPHVVQAIARHADVKITLKGLLAHEPGRDAPDTRQARRTAVVDAVAVSVAVNCRPSDLAFCSTPGQIGGHGRFRTYDPSLVRRVLSH